MTLASPLSPGPAFVPGDVGGRTLSRSRLWKMLVASVLVHAFLTPLPSLLGLAQLLPALELSSGEELIEVELTSLPMGPVAPVPKPPAVPTEPSTPPEPQAPEQVEKVADPAEPAPQAPEEPQERPQTPDTSSPPAAPGPTETFGDPVALSGSAGEIADSNANVRLILFNRVVRAHPLGTQIGGLLSRTPQWRDFFGPSQIDPVRDIDQVLIAGPQLRDSSQVVAVVEHRLEGARIEAAFGALVARSGAWINREKLIARARADRAERLFSAPSERVVVVAPPSFEAQIQALGPDVSFPPSADDVAVTAYLVTPHRATRGIGIQIPESIKWVRLDLRPLPDGGARLKILAEDGSAEEAREHALLFETLIVQATSLDLGKFGGFGSLAKLALGAKKKEYLKSVKFTNRGAMIDGTLEATEEQMQTAVDMLDAFLPAPRSTAPSEPDKADEKSELEKPKVKKKAKKRLEGKPPSEKETSSGPEPNAPPAPDPGESTPTPPAPEPE